MRPRSVKPNIRWRSARRRSNEKSAKQIRREVAAARGSVGSTVVAWGNAAFALAGYGTGTGPRAQQAKRNEDDLRALVRKPSER